MLCGWGAFSAFLTYDFFLFIVGLWDIISLKVEEDLWWIFVIHLNDTENALPSFWPQTCDVQAWYLLWTMFSYWSDPWAQKRTLFTKQMHTLISSTNTLLNRCDILLWYNDFIYIACFKTPAEYNIILVAHFSWGINTIHHSRCHLAYLNHRDQQFMWKLKHSVGLSSTMFWGQGQYC